MLLQYYIVTTLNTGINIFKGFLITSLFTAMLIQIKYKNNKSQNRLDVYKVKFNEKLFY